MYSAVSPINVRGFTIVCLSWLSTAFSIGAATLTATFASVPQGSNVDLTSEGKVDWVHWGLFTDSSLNRKAGLPPLISDFMPQDASNGFAYVYQFADNFNGYSWSDGVPEGAVTNTTTGVWAYGVPTVGSGFRFSVPADTNVRILKVYVGVFAGMGELQVFLTDGSAPAYTNATLSNIRNGPGRVYTINYSASSANQRLIVRWILISPRDATANVTLQAAALTTPGANNPPFAILTNKPNMKIPVGTAITLGAEAFDVDGAVTRVEFYDGETKVGEDDVAPYVMEWNGAAAGHHVVTARAVDGENLSRASHPIDLFVHGSGGALNGSLGLPASFVNLTTDGTGDWIHFGRIDATSLNRKAEVGPQIAHTLLGAATPVQFSNDYTSFAWSDGTPVTSESGTPTGVYVTGFTNGFKLVAPADTSLRTLRVYGGLYGAAGTLQAFLSDASAEPYTDASLNDIYSDRNAVYTLSYRAASAGQVLTVQYRASRVYDMDYGNVRIPAVTLEGPALPPPPRILNARRSGNSVAFEFETKNGQSYIVEYAGHLSSHNWQTLTTVTGNGSFVMVEDDASEPPRFYRLRVP